jgi:hypothetical protein
LPQLKLLVVLPKAFPGAGNGDNVMHAKVLQRLSADMDVKVVTLGVAGRLGRLLNLFRSMPPEIARHIAAGNDALVRAGVRAHAPDVICLFNETTFPAAPVAKASGAGVVLYPHNVHSRIADTHKTIATPLFAHATRRFERRYYGDPDISLVCISKADADYLARNGVRAGVPVAAPGAPPSVPLAPGARVEAALLLTGAYGWWRKRRDIRAFAAEPADPAVACYASPGATRYVDIPGARDAEGLDFAAAIRFGVITDRFAGGFKLKSTEYVALNCAILSFCDIFEDFEGLPHAREFVRQVKSRAEAETIAKTMAADSDAVAPRFAAFKAACLERFDWSRTLEPLEAAVRAAAGPRPLA